MSQIYGVLPATVTSNQDPEGCGRVEVAYTWMEGQTKAFAHVATMMSGKGRGTWFMPEPGDDVIVAFLHGDPSYPYVIGFVWNQKNKPPSTDPAVRLIHSVNDHEIEIYDAAPENGDMGRIRIRDAHGNVVDLSNAQITISGKGTIIIDAPNVIINDRPVIRGAGPI